MSKNIKKITKKVNKTKKTVSKVKSIVLKKGKKGKSLVSNTITKTKINSPSEKNISAITDANTPAINVLPVLEDVHKEIIETAGVHIDASALVPPLPIPENSKMSATKLAYLYKLKCILYTYEYLAENIPIRVTIVKKKGEFVHIYEIEISAISKTTELLLEKVRLELIRRVSIGADDIADIKKTDFVEDKFQQLINLLVAKYFPDSDEHTIDFLRTYLKMNSLGLGSLELLMTDENLEEIVVNAAAEPVWVYHKELGWLKTTIFLKNEDQTRHYASIIGRKVGRQITVLTPLLDAHMESGDRVNATLSPVSTNGNTITIRKFSRDPWTITKFLKTRTISFEAAATIWMAVQYELSTIIAGGTASGKTSALNVFSNFFPPNQRIISIEDTREIVLPQFLHWVPLNTSLPNAEGKGEINMGDLLVNSLRMRPDRILVGEVRRKRETETLFEAIHTGHSVYATFHANSAKETVERLTNAPIDIPKIMLPAISMIVVQFRNRRTGFRRTFQVAEILPNGEANVILQYDVKKDTLVRVSKSKSLYANISLFTGMTDNELTADLEEKMKILNYMVRKNIDDVNSVGRIMAEYYTDKDNLMKYVTTDADFQFELHESKAGTADKLMNVTTNHPPEINSSALRFTLRDLVPENKKEDMPPEAIVVNHPSDNVFMPPITSATKNVPNTSLPSDAQNSNKDSIFKKPFGSLSKLTLKK